MRKARRLAIVALVAAWGFASTARADDAARERSRAAFRRGVTAAEHGDYGGARAAFVEAYQLFPHPSILLNLGIACWKTGAYVEAEEHLAKFLADDGGATQDEIASARAALASSRDHVGTLRVSVAPGTARATLDRKPIALVAGGAIDLRALEGDHRIEVEAEGYEPLADTVHVAPGRTTPLVVALRPSSAPGEPALGRPSRSGIGLAFFGGGVLLAGIGGFAGARALGLAHDYDDPLGPRYQDPSTKSEGIAWRTSADVLFGLAIVSAGVGAWFFFTPGDEPPRASFVVAPGFVGARSAF